jgi:hypothetical protein
MTPIFCNKLENLALLQMIVIDRKAISLASIAMVEEQLSGSLLLTLVWGKEIMLDPIEAEQFLKLVNDAAYNARMLALQQGTPLRKAAP